MHRLSIVLGMELRAAGTAATIAHDFIDSYFSHLLSSANNAALLLTNVIA